MKEPVYDTLLVSYGDVSQKDIERALSTCGWDIDRVFVTNGDPVIPLFSESSDLPLVVSKNPWSVNGCFRLAQHIGAVIFIEPANKPSKYHCLSQFIRPLGIMTYHYHPEFFPL